MNYTGNREGEQRGGKSACLCKFSGICQISLKMDLGYLDKGRLEGEKTTVRSGDTWQSAVFLQHG